MDASDARHRAVIEAPAGTPPSAGGPAPCDETVRRDPTAAGELTLETLERRAAERTREFRPVFPQRIEMSQALALGEQLTDLARTDRRRAHELASAFVEIARAWGNEVQLAVARRCRAHAARHSHRFREALRDYSAATEAFEREGLRVEAARTAIGTVEALMHLGRPGDALRLARRARGIFARAGEEQRAARLDVNLANIYRRLERHEAAFARQKAAEAVFERHGAATDLALTRFNRANSLCALDRYREALPLYEASAAVWRERGMTTAGCQCGLGLGSVLFRLGRWTDAWSVLARAHDDALALDDRALLATAAHDIARVEILLNRNEAALARLDEAIAGFDALTMRADQADALVSRAKAHRQLGRHADAEADLVQAAERFVALGRNPVRWIVELQRAQALRGSDRHAEGRRALRRCVLAFARYRMPGAEIEARLALAEELMESRPREAERQLAWAGRLSDRVRDPWLDYRHAVVGGRLAAHAGREREARLAFERAYRSVRRLRCALPLEVQRAYFMEDKQGLFESALELAASTTPPDLESILLWSERAHVPRLRDAWVRERDTAAETTEDERSTARAVARAREDVYWLDEREQARRGAVNGVSPARRRSRNLDAWRARRTAAVARLERMYHRMELRTAERLGCPVQREPDPRRIRAALGEDELLLDYFVGDSSVHLTSVGRRSLHHARLEVAPAELHALVFRLRRLWDRHQLGSEFRSRHEAALARSTSELLSVLHDALLAPLERLEAPIPRRLTIVPHRWLRGVPFHALLGSDGPLSDRFDVRYSLSGASLVDAPPTGRAGGPPLVVGLASPEAPLAEAEAADVARLLPGSRSLMGPAATPDAVRHDWSRATTIHLASHGAVHESDARLSGVQLAGGAWTVYDLYETPTRADLVVLSACQTGEEVLWGSDDGVGLVPALFRSGARTAIVSLWPVDDATTHSTMVELHGHLSTGVSPGDALARCWSHQRSLEVSPYHWAPFVLYGANSPGGTP